MASSGDVGDHVLWTAVLLTSVAAYWYVPSFLNHVKELAVVEAPKPKPAEPRLHQDAEASIKLSTLHTLANGPNYNITAAALRLIADRFVKDWGARYGLLDDLGSKEWHRRDRAINAFRFLLTHPALRDSDIQERLVGLMTFQAFIIALQKLILEHDGDDKVPVSPIRPKKRSTHESAIIDLLLVLMEDPDQRYDRTFIANHIQPAIDAGIIIDWLKHYPFPCTMRQKGTPSNFRRSDVCRLLEYDVWGTDDPAMSRLVACLLKAPNAPRQFAEIGLRPSIYRKRVSVDLSGQDTRDHPNFSFDIANDQTRSGESLNEDNEELIRGEVIGEMEMLTRSSSSSRRDLRHAAGEMSRQRRHREAIVVAEAGAPLGPENILQRQPTETELQWQQETEESREYSL